MQNCRELEPVLAAYVDGEVAPAERASVEEHMQKCPPCRARLAGEQTVRTALRSRAGALRASAPEALRARCAPQGAALAPAARMRRWVPLSLAATLVLAVAGVFLLGLTNRVDALAAQLTLDHVTCFKLAPKTPTPDAAVAERKWTEAHGWNVAVPAASDSEQLKLICVRRCFVTEGAAAHIMYRWRGRPLSVYVVPEAIMRDGQTSEVMHRFGHDAVLWSERGRTYVLLARGRPEELSSVVQYVKARAR